MFEDLANGVIPNETEYGAKSTMTAILGRLATYSGNQLKWKDAIASEVSLSDVDALQSMDSSAPLIPDENGRYPIARPGDASVKVIDWNLPKKKQKNKNKKRPKKKA